MKRAYFVTGIDTDAGKSIVTGVLARALSARGERVITQKFIQTGCDGLSEDIETHRRIMGIGLLPEDEDGTTHKVQPLIETKRIWQRRSTDATST